MLIAASPVGFRCRLLDWKMILTLANATDQTACEESCPTDLIHLGVLNKRTVLAAVLKDDFMF